MKKNILLLVLFFTSLSIWAQHGEYVGGDVSLLPAYENAGDVYLDGKGNSIPDLLKWFVSECGWNTFRVRLFVNPASDADPAVCQDLDYVKRLGKHIKDAGAKFILDFHYSDTWADPSKQYLPAAWATCATVDQKAARLYSYTKESLEALKDYGATPDFVQVGNEITAGVVGVWRSSDASGFKKIIERGCDAVREVCPEAKIIIHIESPQNTSSVVDFYNALDKSRYDVIGLSYYPVWHGKLDALAATLSRLATVFPEKKVQIVETAYNYQYWPSDAKYDTQDTWACSPDGQYGFVEDLIAELKNHSNVNGLCYWFPEEAGNGKRSKVISDWVNRGLWWPSVSNGGHWPVKGSKGLVHLLLKSFLATTGIREIESEGVVHKYSDHDGWYLLSGQKIAKPQGRGIYIHKGKKYK